MFGCGVFVGTASSVVWGNIVDDAVGGGWEGRPGSSQGAPTCHLMSDPRRHFRARNGLLSGNTSPTLMDAHIPLGQNKRNHWACRSHRANIWMSFIVFRCRRSAHHREGEINSHRVHMPMNPPARCSHDFVQPSFGLGLAARSGQRAGDNVGDARR